MAGSLRRRRPLDIWPGFVDALATLLILIIFVLMVFMVAQYYLSEALSGRDEALQRLNRQISELADMLTMERAASADLRQSLAERSNLLDQSIEERDHLLDQLLDSGKQRDKLISERDALAVALAQMTARAESSAAESVDLTQHVSELDTRIDALEAAIAYARAQAAEGETALTAEREISAEALAQVELLNLQLAALRTQIGQLNAALEASEALSKEQKVQIADLGRRLNVALAGKVQELARYRSEFFGRLREVLGNRPDIQVVGDRFVFQSEVLFDSGSADLADEGQIQVAALAETLGEIASEIPPDIDWVLRVDGHTDRIPINTAQFPSNWELSTARAISVVKFLVEHGIPAERLAATGFGEFQPLDARGDEFAFRRNRRIELKLTQR